MQISIYYVFTPSSALTEAATSMGQSWLLDSETWVDALHDRTGPEHTHSEVEAAFWTVFLAKLAGDNDDDHANEHLRKTCLQLGLRGCWSVIRAHGGDPVGDQIGEAANVSQLAAETGADKL